MKPKEIDKLIFENLGSFLSKEGFKTVKKESWFVKQINGIDFCLSFTHLDYRPEYNYRFILGVFVQQVGDIKCKSNGREDYIGKFSGYTYIFPFSYFLNPDDYINKNPQWVITNEQDVHITIKDVKKFYNKYLNIFIKNHTTLKTLYQTIESDINTGKAYTIDSNIYGRSLIILKLLKSKSFKDKLTEYKQNLLDNDYEEEDFIDMFNYIETM